MSSIDLPDAFDVPACQAHQNGIDLLLHLRLGHGRALLRYVRGVHALALLLHVHSVPALILLLHLRVVRAMAAGGGLVASVPNILCVPPLRPLALRARAARGARFHRRRRRDGLGAACLPRARLLFVGTACCCKLPGASTARPDARHELRELMGQHLFKGVSQRLDEHFDERVASSILVDVAAGERHTIAFIRHSPRALEHGLHKRTHGRNHGKTAGEQHSAHRCHCARGAYPRGSAVASPRDAGRKR
mmetsp:Transcript_29110/g.84302  ORF Transcript_29110/g.84302 Transcript_29110/m.84302 type:complete len:248 (-) Transcript_29110:48-791(-)